MHKVYIWGTGYWGENCFQDILDGVEVCGFVESSVSQCSFQGKQVISGQELEEQEYDYVILANTHEDAILERFHLEEHKTIRYRERPALAGVRLFKYQINDQVRGHMPYLSMECDGLYFLYNRTDILIPNAMSFYKSTWSRAEMLFFWREAPRRDKGIFLDIGANIGTTAIYFRKKLAPDLNYIAFEPVRENVKVLKMNCIANDCEDIAVETVGISNTDGNMGLIVVEANYGGSRVSGCGPGKGVCETVRLDAYVQKNQICPQDIAYIWMDIEGHEADAIAGAKEVLMQSDASLFMEYNAAEYRDNGKLERILDDLHSIYQYFLCYEQYAAGKKHKRAIRELGELAEEMDWQQCNVLFLK